MAELKTLVDKVLSDNKDTFFTQEEIRDEIEKMNCKVLAIKAD